MESVRQEWCNLLAVASDLRPEVGDMISVVLDPPAPKNLDKEKNCDHIAMADDVKLNTAYANAVKALTQQTTNVKTS